MTTWEIDEYNEWIENGCPIDKSVTSLCLQDIDEKLTTITPKIANLCNLKSSNP